MILRTALLLCAMALFALVRGQTITPEVLGTAGEQSQVGTTTVTWTMGESLIETISASGNTVTQGFHQPKYSLVALESPLLTELGISIYPNPTAGQVFMDIDREENSRLDIQLVDMTGRILGTRSTWMQQEKISFDLSQVAAGYYFLRVIQENGSMFKAYKVSKTL